MNKRIDDHTYIVQISKNEIVIVLRNDASMPSGKGEASHSFDIVVSERANTH